MRKALNENQTVQLIVLGVIAVAFAVVLFTMVLGGDDAAPAEDPAAATSEAPAAEIAPATPNAGTEAAPPVESAPAPVTPATPDSAPPTTGGGDASSGLLPSKGLPQDVLVAYAKNDAIVLLVNNPNGTADKRVKASVKRLKSRGDVAVFTVKAKNIADYSRITSGVAVSRVPALIVIRPRNLNAKGVEPTASVSYGFRGPKSVEQQVDNALYKGGEVPAYP